MLDLNQRVKIFWFMRLSAVFIGRACSDFWRKSWMKKVKNLKLLSWVKSWWTLHPCKSSIGFDRFRANRWPWLQDFGHKALSMLQRLRPKFSVRRPMRRSFCPKGCSWCSSKNGLNPPKSNIPYKSTIDSKLNETGCRSNCKNFQACFLWEKVTRRMRNWVFQAVMWRAQYWECKCCLWAIWAQ